MQKRNKVDAMKAEQRAESIVSIAAREMKKKPEEVYNQVAPPIMEQYDGLAAAFEDVVADTVDLAKLGVPPELAKKVTEVVKQRIKPQEVLINGTLELLTYLPEGVEVVKKTLLIFEKQNILVFYLGGGKYRIRITARDYKEAEDRLEKVMETAKKTFDPEGTFIFERMEE